MKRAKYIFFSVMMLCHISVHLGRILYYIIKHCAPFVFPDDVEDDSANVYCAVLCCVRGYHVYQ